MVDVGDKVITLPALGGKRIILPMGAGQDMAKFYCDPAHYVIDSTGHAYDSHGNVIGSWLVNVVCHNTNDVHIWLGRDNYPTFAVQGGVTFYCNPIKKARRVSLTCRGDHMIRIDPYYTYHLNGGFISGWMTGRSIATGLPKISVSPGVTLFFPPDTGSIQTTVCDLGEVCDNIALYVLVVSHDYYPSDYPDPNVFNCVATIEDINFSL